MGNRCAVVGVGQTEHRAARKDVSIAGLVREAALRALADAELTWADIDAVVLGKAPDMFEGVMMPELYLADALGAVGKPMTRVHTAGSVGGSTALVGASLIQSGVHERVLVCAFEKQSESNATWALTVSQPFQAPLVAGAGGYFAPLIRGYMRRSGAPDHIGMVVAVKDRRHALANPYAHLRIPDIDLDMVAASPMLWEPLRYLETCPSSDGACAMVLASEDATIAVEPPTDPAVCTRSNGLPAAPRASERYSSGIITPSKRSGALPTTIASMSSNPRPASVRARSTASRHSPAIDTSSRFAR